MNVSDVSAESALSLLSEEERERAADFVFERDRVRYIFSHGFLRQVLGLYLGIDPQSIPFQFGSNGRPEISSKNHCGEVRFNLSHSGDIALLGVTAHRTIGVDVERVRELRHVGDIANSFFLPEERLFLAGLSDAERLKQFHILWVRKEAVVKAWGVGIFSGLMDLPVLCGEGEMILRVPETSGGGNLFYLNDLPVYPGYEGAFCIEGARPRLALWEWSQ